MKTSLFKSLYVRVLSAIAIGILLGHFYPELGAQMKPLGDAFVKLIKNGYRAGYLLYGCDRYCRDGKYESRRPYRCGGATLFRSGQYRSADYRPDYC